MKKYFVLLLFIFTLVLLTGCSQTASTIENEQPYVPYYSNTTTEQTITATNETIILTESEQVDTPAEMHELDGIGLYGWHECERHYDLFHNYDFFWQLARGLVCSDDVYAWEVPLRDLEATTGECLVNFFTFINYFNIPREAFQELIDNNFMWYFQFGGDTLDILYSGDWVLVDQFFSAGGPAGRGANERSNRYWSERIMTLQQVVYKNTTEMSWYFHDVWTHSHFTIGKDMTSWWMQNLIDAGEYDRVNIVEFLTFFDLYRPSSINPSVTAFENIANRHNMDIFTHYNFDILLSGDWDLIRDYYCITNEAAHSAQVQARFDAYVAANGYTPDTSWMIGRAPTQITIDPAAATVQRGSQQQFAATASGPGNTSQAVTWAVQGAASSGTTITDAGLLRVAQDETAATLTVRAVSTADTIVYATAAVTVAAQPPQSGAPPAAGPSAPSGTTQRPPADSHEHDPQQQDDPAPGAATIPEPPPIPPAPPSFTNPFVDVHERDWFFDYVMYVYTQGIMTGMDTTPMTFAPNAHMTRAMAVQLFYNMEGRPSVAGLPNPFTDVAQDAWYRDAVVWAANNGLVLGLGGGIFAPGNNITRAHLTLILSNYADFADITLPLIREYQAFIDDSDIRYYARESVEQLFRAAVINGRPDGSFDPQGNATRAELATMMHNFR